ncbi:hypothetical protein F5X97DRAFT_326532 [Nemania serpens]|nr:hypothetical protein F5X97DRAFT_326532 [Nemania serpens]
MVEPFMVPVGVFVPGSAGEEPVYVPSSRISRLWGTFHQCPEFEFDLCLWRYLVLPFHGEGDSILSQFIGQLVARNIHVSCYPVGLDVHNASYVLEFKEDLLGAICQLAS